MKPGATGGRKRRLSRRVCAGLLVVAAAGPAAAQEVAVGGGYHVGVTPGSDWITVPSAPTGDVRFTFWGGGRWGVTGRALAGLGGTTVDEHGVYERYRPTYLQVLARFRPTDSMILGIGGGLLGHGERFEGGGSFDWHPHLLAVEALHSRTLTDRLSLRFGVSAVVPVHVHPTVLLAWGF